MIIRSVLPCILACAALALAVPSPAAEKPAPKKTAAKPLKKAPPKTSGKPAFKAGPKTAPKPAVKAAPGTVKTTYKPMFKPVPMPAARGKAETLTCRLGTEDRHARIGIVVVGGRVDSFAYYSKWKPRTCSIYHQRYSDGHSRWHDKGNVTNVNAERGLFMIEHGKGVYRFVFRDVDRERYCGMEGTINGTLTVRKGSEVCELTGIMEEGVPLGQAQLYAEREAAGAVVQASAPAAEPPSAPEPKRVAQRAPRPDTPFPSAGAGISD